MCGNCSRKESAAGNFCLERNRLEVCGEKRQRKRGERKTGGRGEVEKDDRGAKRVKV